VNRRARSWRLFTETKPDGEVEREVAEVWLDEGQVSKSKTFIDSNDLWINLTIEYSMRIQEIS